MKYVYSFNEGSKEMKSVLGGKGSNLCEMKNIGLAIPSGFVISTQACDDFYAHDQNVSDEVWSQALAKLEELEQMTSKTFGSSSNPLLISVRSGASISMPGMMDTILNLGMNDEVCIELIRKTNNEKFILDLYKRFIEMFASVVYEVDRSHFHDCETVKDYQTAVKNACGKEVPNDPYEQMKEAVEAVFLSWNNERAVVYRNLNNIPHNLGTAVTVQEMVFGNLNEASGTGICFTRNPSTGEKKLFGEYMICAQGEDLVAGIKTPQKLEVLKEELPTVYNELVETAERLEKHYKDIQDIEFTIEDNKLYLLQTRNGKRSAKAAVNIAVDLVEEGLIDKVEALRRIETKSVEQLLFPNFSVISKAGNESITKGLNASSGASIGHIYFTSKDCEEASDKGIKTILVREETSPDDIKGMINSEAIVTVHGGMTSHAAVIARGMGKCCVVGAGEISINEESKYFECRGKKYYEGDLLSVDGFTGEIYDVALELEPSELPQAFETILEWADEYKNLSIHANCDTPEEAKKAVEFGARGIGLCRTEHMFFDERRLPDIQKLMLTKDEKSRAETLRKLYLYQYQDFKDIFEVMDGFPVTIRLLDPPLHEFLPKSETEISRFLKVHRIERNELLDLVNELKEYNPMLGHRGSRLGITYPDIYKMQVEALADACLYLTNRGIKVNPEIMVPLVGSEKELHYLKEIIEEVMKTNSRGKYDYKIGTMIEIPRAAITSHKLANIADFFSFGTNDLTQMTYGFSRDDSASFINAYMEKNLLESNPFMTIDVEGVGKLIELSKNLAKLENKDIKIGVCGEHGGDPDSINFFNDIGLDYVSCSTYRVPIARLAAAKAVINQA